MLYTIMDFIFRNILLIILIILIIYVYRQYKYLKENSLKINDIFEKVLNNYLITRIKEVETKANEIKNMYKDTDEIKTEIDRLLINVDKGINGKINDKVECSNAINKYKLNKSIEIDKYPKLEELNNLGTFTEMDMSSLDNGIALARKEYNAMAFKYNEKSSAFPMQYLAKILGLSPYYVIFDAPKAQTYAANYEVFEEAEPVIDTISILNNNNDNDIYLNTLSSMNRTEDKHLPEEEQTPETNVEEEKKEIEETNESSES